MAFDALDVLDTLELAPQVQEAVALVPGLELHLDGDYAAYYCAGDEDCSKAQAKKNLQNRIDFFKFRSGADKVIVHSTALGSHKGERYSVATVKPYQGQRTSERKPKNYEYMLDHIQSYEGPAFRAKVWNTREADDGIAACALHAAANGTYIVIGTADKDMRMLPGLHIGWKKGEVTMVPPGAYNVIGNDVKQYGLKWFWLQMLMGDAADHIPGLEHYQAFNAKGQVVFKKMGEVTAEKMLATCRDSREAYAVVSELYLNAYSKFDDDGKLLNPGEWADRFCEQAALLWMRGDKQASVGDFARHNGVSRINHDFCDQMWAAVSRLEKRIKTARAEADALTGQTHSG